METSTIKKWVIFFLGILIAILLADALANLIVTTAGLGGWQKLVINFILYAALFFGILYVMEKVFDIEFFGFGRCLP
ncbi:MAG: hypothetical protein LUP97_06125 [Methanoregula sp.]|jgi:hypothetical protein|nr:hypothetical protein [Methanoregula sp.]WML68322.1 MAG: hypothetical protein METHP_01933 [Methanoregula sp. SKADARSKE-2]